MSEYLSRSNDPRPGSIDEELADVLDSINDRFKPDPYISGLSPKDRAKVLFVAPITKEELESRPQTVEDYTNLVNDYFIACADAEIRPTVTGLALALGLASTSAIERLGQRRPDLRYVLGRALVAVQNGYESLIGAAPAPGIIYALNNIPDGFDLEESPGSPSPRFWQSRQEVHVQKNISAVIGTQVLDKDLTPQEAYARVIEGHAVRVEEVIEDASDEPSPEQAHELLQPTDDK